MSDLRSGVNNHARLIGCSNAHTKHKQNTHAWCGQRSSTALDGDNVRHAQRLHHDTPRNNPQCVVVIHDINAVRRDMH